MKKIPYLWYLMISEVAVYLTHTYGLSFPHRPTSRKSFLIFPKHIDPTELIKILYPYRFTSRASGPGVDKIMCPLAGYFIVSSLAKM